MGGPPRAEPADVSPPSRADWIVFAVVGVLLLLAVALSLRPIPGALPGEVLIAPGGDWTARDALAFPAAGGDGRTGTWPLGTVRAIRYPLPPSRAAQRLIAEPGSIDTLDVTLLTLDGEVLLQATLGDRHPPPSDGVPALRQNLLLPPLPDGATLIVRVETKGTNALTLSVVSIDGFAQREALAWLALAVFLAGRLLLLVLSTIEMRAQRQAVWAWFAVQNLLSVAYTLAGGGALRILLPDAFAPWIDTLGAASVAGYMASTFVFHALMLRLFGAPPGAIRLSLIASAIPFAALALLAVGFATAGVAITSASVIVFGVLVIASATTLRAGAGAPVGLVRIAFAAIGTAALTQALPIFGVVPMSQFSLAGGTLTPLVGGLLALWLLLRRVEGQRRAAIETERRLALALQRATLDRESRLAADRFVGVLAHTIRTPLSLIRLVLEDAAAGPRAGELARLAVRDVDGVLERCVQLARLELGETTLRRAPTEVAAVITSAIEWTRLAGRARCEGGAGRANVDAHALGSIAFELLDNAYRYAPEGSPVETTWTIADDAVTLVVTSEVGRLGTLDPTVAFDRYARGERAHAVTGAGLGLHLVRTLARLHGGEATYTCAQGRVRVEVVLAC
jgi:two-component system, sensor histidine kinase LadS